MTVLSLFFLWITFSFAAPNAMNYQGRVTDASGEPVADGSYLMEFWIYDAEIEGTALWWDVTQYVSVTDGIYNVTLGQGEGYGSLDAALFSEDNRWLEVWFDGEKLFPRQKLTSAAYAFQAGSTTAGAVTSVMLADDAVTETKVQDGAITAGKIAEGFVSGLDSDKLDGYEAADFAPAVHNHDTQYYTKTEVDNLVSDYESRIAALENLLAKFSVSGDGRQIYITEANLHVRSGSGATNGAVNGLGNVIIGYNESRLSTNDKSGSHNLVVGYEHNYSNYAGIVVGYHNTISGQVSSVSGGHYNIASGDYSSVSGGWFSTASGIYSSISGGYHNEAIGSSSSVSGGSINTADGDYSSISGGSTNTAGGVSSSVSGGHYNIASGDYSSVGGGYYNETTGSSSSVSGGRGNTAGGNDSSVSGGRNNRAEGDFASVSGGGSENSAYGNVAYADYSAVLGGIYNIAGNQDSGNHAIGKASTVSGGDTNRATGTYTSIGGGKTNIASGYASSVSGGRYNQASGQYSFVGGGGSDIDSNGNHAFGNYSAILGGANNFTGDFWMVDHSLGINSTVCGGSANYATGRDSSVSGGGWNNAVGENSTVSGGTNNLANGLRASVMGGDGNHADGMSSSVSGGRINTASGDYTSVVGDIGNTFVDATSIP
jgi:hypothetical protein